MKFIHLLVLAALASLMGCSSTPEVSEDELRAPFTENKADIEKCYAKAKEKNPELTGTLELKFLINEEGKAYKTVFLKKRSTINNKALNVCLKRLVHSWQFPSGSAVELVYPFQFGAEATAPEAPAEDSEAAQPAPTEEAEPSSDEATPD